MEEEEKARLEAHEAKKGLERAKKASRDSGHMKVVARQFAKNFHSSLKPNVYRHLLDVSIFHDDLMDNKMKCDVLPWLMK